MYGLGEKGGGGVCVAEMVGLCLPVPSPSKQMVWALETSVANSA